jgi:hypothetical protein
LSRTKDSARQRHLRRPIGNQKNALAECCEYRHILITEDELPDESAVAKEIPSQDKAFAQNGEIPSEPGIDVTSIILFRENTEDALL